MGEKRHLSVGHVNGKMYLSDIINNTSRTIGRVLFRTLHVATRIKLAEINQLDFTVSRYFFLTLRLP